MGYELHITRQEDWADEDDINAISLREWLDYVAYDEELALTDGYQMKIPGVEGGSQNAPGFCDWSGHSVLKGEFQPWFDYCRGCISTKNPDDETIKKMIAIAAELDAKVIGDEGEIYDETYFLKQQAVSMQTDYIIKKAWWKFW